MTPCHQGVKEHGDGLGYPGLLAWSPDRHHAESAPCIMQGSRSAGVQEQHENHDRLEIDISKCQVE